MVIACLVAACTSMLVIAILRQFATSLGLVDRPNERKYHGDNVPVIGGLAVFLGMVAGAICYGQFLLFTHTLLGTAAMLALLGGLDDRFDLSVRIRLLVQIAATLVVIAVTGVYVHTLGHIAGYDLELGWIGVPLTVVAVIGLLNAFNMMDGIDGLAGGLALVSVGAIILFSGNTVLLNSAMLLALLTTAALPYLAANLGFMGRKIFMGDAGSMVIGYLLAWTLIRLSQEPSTQLSSVDVLWCVALPVLDTLAVMYRRLRQGESPFKPDRGHIHHILLRAGLSPRVALIALIGLAIAIALLGKVTSSLSIGTGSNLATFCIFMVIYIATVTRTWLRQEARRISIRRQPAANDAESGATPIAVTHRPLRVVPKDNAQTHADGAQMEVS